MGKSRANCIKILWASLRPLHFHMHFRIRLLISIFFNPSRIMTEKALTLQVNLRKSNILIIVNLLIHRQVHFPYTFFR